MNRAEVPVGPPCAACLADSPPPTLAGGMAGRVEDGQVWPCGHTTQQVESERLAVLALGAGMPVGTPIQRKPAPRDPAEGR